MYKKSWRYMNDPKKESKPKCAEPAPEKTATIPDLDIKVNHEDHEDGVKDVLKHVKPEWKRDDIKFKPLLGGMVNLMMAAYVDEDKTSDWVVVRVFGNKKGWEWVDKGLDRSFESKAGQLFAQLDAGPPVLGVFKNGVVYGYVDGQKFSWEDVSPFRNVKLRHSIAGAFAHIHCQKTFQQAKEMGLDKAKSAIDIVGALVESDFPDVIIDEETTKWYKGLVPSFEERKKELAMIIDKMHTASIPYTLCHNDTNPTNLIYQEDKDKIVFIDLEACGIGNPIMDIHGFLDGAGAAFEGSPDKGFSREEREDFIRVYLSERNRLDKGSTEVDEEDVKKYCDISDMFIIGMCYMVHIIMPQMAEGEEAKNYLDLALQRLDYYNKNRDRMLALHS